MQTQEICRADYEGLLAWWQEKRRKAGPEEARKLDASLAEWKAYTRISEDGTLSRIVLESVPDAAFREQVAAAVGQGLKIRKRMRKAERRRARESAAVRAVVERQLLAARFSEATLGQGLREASADDLAVIAATTLASQPAPAPRPVIELETPPSAMDFDELGLAALAGSAGSAPFFAATPGASLTAARSPFHTYRPASGATKGTAHA